MQRMKHKGFLYVCTTGVLGVSCCPNDNPSSIQTSLTCRLPSGQTAGKASPASSVLCSVVEIQTWLPFPWFPQAPSNMKSVLQAGWLLTVAVGNIIVLIVAGAGRFSEQVPGEKQDS